MWWKNITILHFFVLLLCVGSLVTFWLWEKETSKLSYYRNLGSEIIESPRQFDLAKALLRARKFWSGSYSNLSNEEGTRNHSGILLMWDHPWGVPSEPPQEGTYGKCTFTFDRATLKVADAVIFHFSLFAENPEWTFYRSPQQRFVWYSWENPWVVRWFEKYELDQHDNFFNWTMTYRRDSDVYAPYISMRKLYDELPKGKEVIDQLMSEKKGLAAWVVSECAGKKGAILRMNIYKELSETVPNIDTFGKCFGTDKNNWPHAKMARFVRTRKFYLAFENSRYCRDYITEKFFRNGFVYGAVPIVWGPKKDDYLAIAPPHSFIHVEDFASIAELGKYILYLDSNDTAYREYFKWREDPKKGWDGLRLEVEKQHPGVKTVSSRTAFLERLCEMVYEDHPPKVIPSINKWFYNENDDCQALT